MDNGGCQADTCRRLSVGQPTFSGHREAGGAEQIEQTRYKSFSARTAP